MKTARVASMLRDLYREGWSKTQIEKAGGPTSNQQLRILRGLGDRCYRPTVESVVDLHRSLQFRQDRLPSGPLVDRILFHFGYRIKSTLDESDRRQFYRMQEQGWVDLYMADDWCLRYLGLHLFELYPEAHMEVAA